MFAMSSHILTWDRKTGNDSNGGYEKTVASINEYIPWITALIPVPFILGTIMRALFGDLKWSEALNFPQFYSFNFD